MRIRILFMLACIMQLTTSCSAKEQELLALQTPLTEKPEDPLKHIGNRKVLNAYFSHTGNTRMIAEYIHAIVAILVVAAIITPTSDVFTLSLVALLIWLLHEISIWIVKTDELGVNKKELSRSPSRRGY